MASTRQFFIKSHRATDEIENFSFKMQTDYYVFGTENNAERSRNVRQKQNNKSQARKFAHSIESGRKKQRRNSRMKGRRKNNIISISNQPAEADSAQKCQCQVQADSAGRYSHFLLVC